MMKTTIALAACAAFILGGCATGPSADSYSQGQAQREMSVRMGVVDSVRPVTLEGTQSGTGTLVGGALGGIAGSNIGGGNRGSAVGTILGAVGGAIAGNAIEEGTTKKAGLEITVRFDNGTMSAITQAADEQFRPGDRVRVLSGGGVTRVTH
ncbi:outer membrane lipoprotein pcp precursor [mine drainage metagenome]|uniref:Outer membrane lipoprotein pcp n=1 Tax=mine drainage metagenome TaxID=410659 RepID=A0A1J5SRY6_9ZZZZ